VKIQCVEELKVAKISDGLCEIAVEFALIESQQHELFGLNGVFLGAPPQQFLLKLGLVSGSPLHKFRIAQQSINQAIRLI
jgi:hypothetical protein